MLHKTKLKYVTYFIISTFYTDLGWWFVVFCCQCLQHCFSQ